LLDQKFYDVDLSIVVPAFNEEARLPVMMKDTVAVNSFHKNNSFSTWTRSLKKANYSRKLN